MSHDSRHSRFRDAHDDKTTARYVEQTPQTMSPSYRLAYADEEFLLRDEMRSVRLQLELMKPELALDEAGINSTVVLFGGARIRAPGVVPEGHPMAKLATYYTQAERLAALVTKKSLDAGGTDWVVCTGGGPGVMEAGNKGAHEAGGRSVGLSIVLPHEQVPNRYVTPELTFNFHYFAVRKMHFLMRARAVCVFPGGFGTLDETFEALTLIQTGRMERQPVLFFGRSFWEGVINFEKLVEAGTISPEDLDLFRFVETAEEALEAIESWEGAGTKRSEIPGRKDLGDPTEEGGPEDEGGAA
ncbi:putative lysine decarboxylase [Pseudooceanicola marinus]|uniref:Cytokinin riboside 5'-monophosphate phosphoribohydrolase n=1 Tax=Pseudooceanicola marinus TaxID=396013 RepID=A0A1X6ZWJ3_9RHOB|nr:TIGR00730 family Rossman fold protein [Pseudooceanicola marinus]PJE30567.1 TIGR00730 family Rossman fold protein [Pseudooceanicola marinus]SLN61724.1 putative lysine decarboxylase [Pseudooceanicola marinus]